MPPNFWSVIDLDAHVKVQRTDGGAVVQQVCRTLRYSISFCCYLRRKGGLWKKKTNPAIIPSRYIARCKARIVPHFRAVECQRICSPDC